jgi:hypothetical protein
VKETVTKNIENLEIKNGNTLELKQGRKGETSGVCTPPYSTRTSLEKKYQWSTTGVSLE